MMRCMHTTVARAARLSLLSSLVALLWLSAASQIATASVHAAQSPAVALGPVPKGILAAVNPGGERFVTADHLRVGVTRRQAVTDAINESPWFGYATGASLARTRSSRTPSRVGTPVWLVSIMSISRVDGSGRSLPARSQRARPASRRSAVYTVVVLSARTGSLLEADQGFIPRLQNPAPHRCRVPPFAGPLLGVVIQGSIAGCSLRSRGAAITDPRLQTVQAQLPAAGAIAPTVTLTVNPTCARSALSGPPAGEPLVTPGPTRLVAGLFLVGGPLLPFSTPQCAYPPEPPWAGSITIMNAAATIVETKTVAQGELATFDVPAGTYTISGTFASATDNDQPIRATPATVTVASGTTVRQDIGSDVP